METELAFGSGEPVLCMAIGANGTRLVAAGRSEHAIAYSVSYRELGSGDSCAITEFGRISPSGGSAILSVALTSDGSLLCTGGEAKVAQIWVIRASGEMELTHEFRTSTTIWSLSVAPAHSSTSPRSKSQEKNFVLRSRSPDPTASAQTTFHLAVGLADCTEVYQLDWGSGATGRLGRDGPKCQPLLWIDCQAAQGGVAICSTGQVAIAGEHLVSVHNFLMGGSICRMPREGRVRCVAFSPNGGFVVSGGFDRKVMLHDIETGTRIAHYDGAEDLVRSVHLSTDSSRMAMGSEMRGKGHVCLYDVKQSTLIAEWQHTKPVWCVRIAPNGSSLAAAGYDMRLTMYDLQSLEECLHINYTSSRGPAFIWSMAYSLDSSHMVVGCWSGNAHVYRLVHKKGVSAPHTMLEKAVIKRADRVYAVASDAKCNHVCIGGRDKQCALFKISQDGEDSSPQMVWSATSEDFVYSVALSPDLTYCAFGGADKSVVVLNGHSGVQVCKIQLPGTVWTIGLLPESACLVIGGESTVIKVYDLNNHELISPPLPVSDTTYAVSITSDAICFSNGTVASIYGGGEHAYGWGDAPSFGVFASLIMNPMLSAQQLTHCVELIMKSHPTVVNLRDPVTGTSMLQYVVSNSNNAKLLDTLLTATCSIGLYPDVDGRTCLHTALELGKWRAIQQLLGGFEQKRFSIVPGAMHMLADCFDAIATNYPREFLHYIEFMPLEPEPEVLGDPDVAASVMLPSVLLCGSSQRSPRDLWRAKLEQYSSEGAAAARSASLKASGWDSKAVLQFGYNKTLVDGLQAYRVPIEDFAGRLRHGKSRVAPLQLIVDAVDRTRDYSVFGSQLMQMLIDFKWHGFAQRIFYRQCAMHFIHVIIVLTFNLRVAATFRFRPDPLGRSDDAEAEYGGGGQVDVIIILGLLWTSFQCLWQARHPPLPRLPCPVAPSP